MRDSPGEPPEAAPRRAPNHQLGALLTDTGISNAGLARRVNDLGATRGMTLRYDKTSVARWVGKGMVPQGPVRHLITAVFSERLGRPVTLTEIGLDEDVPVDPDLGLSFPRDLATAVRGAAELWRHDHVDRRDFLSGTFATAAYAVPMGRWLITPADARAEHTGSPRQVGHSDVEKLREAAAEARRWDSKYGGGDWRASMVPECLRSDAAPLIQGTYPDSVGRPLFSAAGELSRLAGWMAYDTGQHEVAQRYYIQALRLCRAAADVPLGGYVLSSMSLQAVYRGDADGAVDLAQAAVERNRGIATARVMGFLHLVEARAQAKFGDARLCAQALNAAESSLERARAGDEDPEWIGFFTYDRLCADGAECYRDLRMPEQTRRFTADALAGRSENFMRSHGLRLVVGAQADLQAGDLDAACAGGMLAVEVAGRVRSERHKSYVRDLLTGLQPFGDERRVRELTDRAKTVAGITA